MWRLRADIEGMIERREKMARKFKVTVELNLTFDEPLTAEKVQDKVDKEAQKLLETIPDVDDGYVEITYCESAE